MTAPPELLERLRSFNRALQATDPEAGNEGLESMPGPPDEGLEAIILKTQRPVLAIRDNQARLVFDEEVDSQVWKERLRGAAPLLDTAIRAVGRIEVEGHPNGWIGTGWLVKKGIVVTNRHVAEAFASRRGVTFTFDAGVRASVDFLQEAENPKTLVFRLSKVLHIEEKPGPDIAFFAVDAHGHDATPIVLSKQAPARTENAAVIGYPAKDPREPEQALMVRIFRDVFDKKRLAPGSVIGHDERCLFHDCSTLGGNSGSTVIDLATGEALGLHFKGRSLERNSAVRADVVRDVLDRLDRPKPRPPQRRSTPEAAAVPRVPPGTVRFEVPLVVTVSLGTPAPSPPVAARRLPALPDEVVEDAEEAVPADYADRQGFDAAFLGAGADVPLPRVVRDAADVLTFQVDGEDETELRYEHFSVVMSRSRRVCRFSATNIDGATSRKTKRKPWRRDPRIPAGQQILNECYGNPPKFSRGHMTRREDPAWGDVGTAQRGSDDSMHVTNTTPQLQAFNSPIWLGLEDYALQNAREADMRISVITGPYLEDDDPVRDGVRIPRRFWKVIAFVHDETGELCATGYEMSQERNLAGDEEFVFGNFVSPQLNEAAQVPIASIEAKAGLDLGGLADLDPLGGGEEAVGGGEPLVAFEQIRFTG